MLLTTKDICMDLGVTRTTVQKWIVNREIIATKVNNRDGWKIQKSDYEKFLKKHEKYLKIHEGRTYSYKKITARRELCDMFDSYISKMKAQIEDPRLPEGFKKGWLKAIAEIEQFIDKERVRTND